MKKKFYFAVKRLFDFVFSALGVVVLIPVAIIIKILYLATGDKAPILYHQTRIGKDGKPFKLWKFRTMDPNAEGMLQELLKQEKYRKEWDEKGKLDDDPRITKLGDFLRITSIDELPQLFNVLVGDMSFIGPRPLIPGELEERGGSKFYWKIKPGITGWWGCNGRSSLDYRRRLKLEYYYIRKCSFCLDLVCMYKTVIAVVIERGAE